MGAECREQCSKGGKSVIVLVLLLSLDEYSQTCAHL
jgi:hypothetical protein